MTGCWKTASGFSSAVWKKPQPIPAVKETRPGAPGNLLVKGKQGVCVPAAAFSNSPAKRGWFIYSNTALGQVGRGQRVARKETTIQKGCVCGKIVSGESREREGGGEKPKGTVGKGSQVHSSK